jgi:hypothetical protein
MNQMNEQQLRMLQMMFFVMPFAFLIITVILIIPYWFIWKKAGFSPWFSLLMFVPFVNLIMLYVLAFSEWKVVPVPSPVPYPGPLPPSL